MSNLIWVPPKYLAWSVFKSPEMSTLVQPAVSGKTTRAQLYADPVWNYKLRWELLKDNDGPPSSLDTLVDFFLSRGGSYDSFLYADPDDSSVTGQLLGYGDGVTTQFQLARQFLSAGGFYETIQNPNVVTAVKLNGTPQAAFTYAIGTENLLLFSQDFTNAVWAQTGLTVTGNTAAAPDGTTTADKLARNGSGGTYLDLQLVNLAANGIRINDQLSFSSYAIQGTVGVKFHLELAWQNAAGVTLLTSAMAAQTLTASWQRFTLTATVPIGATQVACRVVLDNTTTTGDFITVWGEQLERWAIASGYLATTAATVQPNGLVTFATAPTAGQLVTADFSFYYRVRFKNDLNEFEQFMSKLWQLQQLELVSDKI